MTAAQRPQLHATSLGMLSRCGVQFAYRYLENRIIPPGVAAVTGMAVDTSVTKNLGHKIESGALLPREAVLDAARDGLESAWSRGVALSDEEATAGVTKVKGEAIDKAVRLADLHADIVAPTIEPTHVQRKWTVKLEGYPMDLVGTLDVQEGRAFVRDTKTTGKSPAADAADVSEQLTVYAMAVKVIDGQAPVAVALDYLVDNKKPVARTLVSRRTDDDFLVQLRRVERAAKVIESGAFAPAPPDAWWCSLRFCGYAQICPYFRRPVAVAVGGHNDE